MGRYVVPPNLKEKEKIIGGILNMNQFLWIVAGLVLGGIIFIGLFIATSSLAFSGVIGFLFILSGTPFALYKKNGLTLYEYIVRNRRFKRKVKHMPKKKED